MIGSILYDIDSRFISALLFVGIIIFYFIGLSFSAYQKEKIPALVSTSIGPFEGALLGLLSLLLAFTFNKSASYSDKSREVLVNETNAIGTALLRADLYPDSIRQAFRSDFEDYILVRIQYFEAGVNEKKIQEALQKANLISQKIWLRTAAVAEQTGTIKSMQMIPAVNNMIDVVSIREEARNAHVPESILWLLFFLCIIGSFVVGYASVNKKADWIILIGYSLMTVMTVYLILDLDQSRQGLITAESTHRHMYKLLDSFKAGK